MYHGGASSLLPLPPPVLPPSPITRTAFPLMVYASLPLPARQHCETRRLPTAVGSVPSTVPGTQKVLGHTQLNKSRNE